MLLCFEGLVRSCCLVVWVVGCVVDWLDGWLILLLLGCFLTCCWQDVCMVTVWFGGWLIGFTNYVGWWRVVFSADGRIAYFVTCKFVCWLAGWSIGYYVSHLVAWLCHFYVFGLFVVVWFFFVVWLFSRLILLCCWLISLSCGWLVCW